MVQDLWAMLSWVVMFGHGRSSGWSAGDGGHHEWCRESSCSPASSQLCRTAAAAAAAAARHCRPAPAHRSSWGVSWLVASLLGCSLAGQLRKGVVFSKATFSFPCHAAVYSILTRRNKVRSRAHALTRPNSTEAECTRVFVCDRMPFGSDPFLHRIVRPGLTTLQHCTAPVRTAPRRKPISMLKNMMWTWPALKGCPARRWWKFCGVRCL